MGPLLFNILLNDLFLKVKDVNIVSSADDNKQIFHAFLFNIRNYSPEVINIQRSEAEFNIILREYFRYQTNKIWEDKG